jgi:hypothetical protein
MTHASNIKAFATAAGSPDFLIQSYCGLVAIELVIKQEVGLADHDVCYGLNKFCVQKAIGSRSWCSSFLLSLANQLRNDINAIQVNGKDGLPRAAPAGCYPYIRYTRIDNDGWPVPNTNDAALQALAKTVQQILSLLRRTFGVQI